MTDSQPPGDEGRAEELEAIYERLMSRTELGSLDDDRALELAGKLTDLSLDLGRKEGLERAVDLLEELQRRDLSPNRAAISHYFLGNAWGNLRSLSGRARSDWEQPELEHEVFHHRVALLGQGVEGLEQRRVYQILTNLGNTMSQVGRSSEAVEYWDRAHGALHCLSIVR